MKTISSFGAIEVLNEKQGDADESQVDKIAEVLYDNNKGEIIFFIDGVDQGVATRINARQVYGCIFVKAKTKARVSVSSKAGKHLAVSRLDTNFTLKRVLYAHSMHILMPFSLEVYFYVFLL